MCLCKVCKAGEGVRGLHSSLQGSLTTCQRAIKPDGKIRRDCCFIDNCPFFLLLSDTSGKRVGPPPEPITDVKRPRVGPPPENPPNLNPAAPPHPQAVQAPLFVPPRARYPPAPPQGRIYHQVIMPRLPPAPYVPPLQHLPPLNNNNNNNIHHHHHNPPVNPHHHNMDVMDLPMHYGPPHRYYRRF